MFQFESGTVGTFGTPGTGGTPWHSRVAWKTFIDLFLKLWDREDYDGGFDGVGFLNIL